MKTFSKQLSLQEKHLGSDKGGGTHTNHAEGGENREGVGFGLSCDDCGARRGGEQTCAEVVRWKLSECVFFGEGLGNPSGNCVRHYVDIVIVAWLVGAWSSNVEKQSTN